MKYIYQLGIILIITFIGEAIYTVIPLPIPASIYGILIMLICLKTKIIKLEKVEDAGNFMLEIMPIMFIPATVGLMVIWVQVLDLIAPILIIIVVSSVIVIVTTGLITQFMLKEKGD